MNAGKSAVWGRFGPFRPVAGGGGTGAGSRDFPFRDRVSQTVRGRATPRPAPVVPPSISSLLHKDHVAAEGVDLDFGVARAGGEFQPSARRVLAGAARLGAEAVAHVAVEGRHVEVGAGVRRQLQHDLGRMRFQGPARAVGQGAGQFQAAADAAEREVVEFGVRQFAAAADGGEFESNELFFCYFLHCNV